VTPKRASSCSTVLYCNVLDWTELRGTGSSRIKGSGEPCGERALTAPTTRGVPIRNLPSKKEKGASCRRFTRLHTCLAEGFLPQVHRMEHVPMSTPWRLWMACSASGLSNKIAEPRC